MSSRPELTIQPNVITNLEENVWLNFVYSNGLPNSVAMIRVDHASIGPYQLTHVMAVSIQKFKKRVFSFLQILAFLLDLAIGTRSKSTKEKIKTITGLKRFMF
jgi:hypothetical protein